MEYPPEPWDLEGHGYIAVWLVPSSALPPLPEGVRPWTFFGRVIVATAFVDYLPGGLLPYHELLAAVLVRGGLTITRIWVDSPASKAGGRELWGIPKELAEFEMAHEPVFGGSATAADVTLAEARVRPVTPGLKLPFPLKAKVLQELAGRLARTPIRVLGTVSLARSRWHTGGELGWLSARRPLLSLQAKDFRMRFGPKDAIG